MKPATRQLVGFLATGAILLLLLFAFFQWFYQPELALRTQIKRAKPDTAEVERLIRLANENRLDLTDTLQLAGMLKDMGRINDELALFQRIKDRYPSTPAIRLWYAERLNRYERWLEAEDEYKALLDVLEHVDLNQHRTDAHSWRAKDKDLLLAGRSRYLAQHFAPILKDEIQRKLAENAMTAGAAATGAMRQAWIEKSRDYFSKSLELNPDNPETRGAYANLLLQSGEAEESLQQYQTLLKTDEDNTGWLVSAALAASAAKHFFQAEHFLRRALNLENRTEWRLELARNMSWGGRHDAALGEIDSLIDQFPEETCYRHERSLFLLNAQRHREYLQETARLAAANPFDFGLRLNRINAMLGMQAYNEAVNEASALLALEPENPEAALLLARALLWKGDYPPAQAAWQALAKRFPHDHSIQKNLGQSLLWGKRYDEALVVFRLLNPAAMEDLELAQGFIEAVAAHQAPTKADVTAVRAIRKAVAAKPATEWPVPLLSALGRALRNIGDKEDAVAILRTAADRAKSNLKLRLELADLLQDIGRRQEADLEYRNITNMDSKDTP